MKQHRENAICEQCHPASALYCTRCQTWTCEHLSLWAHQDELGPEGEQVVHRCNWCQGELTERQAESDTPIAIRCLDELIHTPENDFHCCDPTCPYRGDWEDEPADLLTDEQALEIALFEQACEAEYQARQTEPSVTHSTPPKTHKPPGNTRSLLPVNTIKRRPT